MQNSKVLNRIRCVKCQGTGLIERKVSFKCLSCGSTSPTKKCRICEHMWKWGNVEECNVCWGAGEIQIKQKEKKNKKQ